MKTKRIINGAFWATLSLATCIGTCVYWHNAGCGWESLIAAIAYYTACPAAIWATIDAAIQGK